MLSISLRSTVYVRVQVSATLPNGSTIDPTSDVVAFAFVGPYGSIGQAADNAPTASTTWYTGSWDSGTPYTARVLVGPSQTPALIVGSYVVWVKITDSPEIPVLFAGPLAVS